MTVSPVPLRRPPMGSSTRPVPTPGSAPARGPARRLTPAWQAWFAPASLVLGAAAFAGAEPFTLLALITIVAAAASRDLWQVGLALLLASLTLATATVALRQEFNLPFLLRFILASALIAYTVTAHRGRRLPPAVSRHVRILGLFFVAVSIGAFLSRFQVTAVEGVAGTAAVLGIPVAAARGRWRRPEALVADLGAMHRFLWLVTVVGVSLAAAGGFDGRATGIHANPNTFAFMCLLGFGLDLGLRKHLPFYMVLVTAPIFLIGVVATGSRGALLGVLVAPAYLLLRRRGRQRSARIAAGMLLGFAFLLAVPLPGTFDLQDVLDRTFGGERVDLSGRQEAWDNMLVLYRSEPVFGHGLRSTNLALGAAREVGDVEDGLGGHSSYLAVLAETGLTGAIPLFGAILLALLLPAPRDPNALTAWVAASGVVVAGLGHMIGESFVLGVGSPFPLVFWTGVTVLTLVGGPRQGSGRG
jgi:O-antigen ligase